MAKKIIIASSGLVFVVCIGLIVFAITATSLTIDPARGSAARSQMDVAKENVLSLIESGRYTLAWQQLDLLIADFNEDPGLPDALYAVAARFGWSKRYEEAKGIFDGIIADYPQSGIVDDARLYSARMNACSLARSNRTEDLLVAVDSIIAGFAANPNVAEAIYWTGKQCEWSSNDLPDRATRYQPAVGIYQRVIEQFPESEIAGQATLAVRQLTHRTNIFTLMGTGDQNVIDAVIAAMAADFNNQPELVGELYWCAREYEQHPDKYEQRWKLCEFIIKQFPQSDEAIQIPLDIRRVELLELIRAGEVNEAEIALNEFIADFNQHPYGGDSLNQLAMQLFEEGVKFLKTGLREKAMERFERASAIWRRMTEDEAIGGKDVAYYYAGVSLQKMRRWEDAAWYYQKVVEGWPDYEHVCGAQAAVGWCYEILRNEGKIPKEEINPFIEQAYTAVLEDYPDCYVADYAAYRLGELNFEKGDKVNAAVYYRMFLELAKPGDRRIDDAKAKLEKVEGNN